ncbi:uncharacterized protein LOC120700307 [Panicum virgatum]|uniref:uncharacterized protein LOC120700307 n=1 Tax=Panicum virgatum TaxID=38727 RepID=UPI0019D5E866|nr:uncharacterized protein LOC120700307 [Panicum virgatum]
MMLMMESMRSQQELLMQLFDDVIGCNVSVASKLEGCLIMSTTGDDDDGPAVELVVDDKSKSSLARKRNSTITGDRTTDRIRNKPSLIIALVKREGTYWNYYRCAYRERKCLATKTIEQQEQNNAGTSSSAIAGVENAKYTVVYYGDHTCKDHNISMVQAPQQQPVNMDLQNGEMAQATANVQEPETDLDLPALLEVFDNSLVDWDDGKM